MTAVPLSTWDSPVGDIVIEVKLAAQYARSASDGVTLTDAVGRSVYRTVKLYYSRHYRIGAR